MNKLILGAAAVLLVSACASHSGDKTGMSAQKSFHYVCEDGTTFDAVYEEELAILTMPNGQRLKLPQQISGSGVRYATATHEFHTKGDMGVWTVGRRASTTCSAR